METNESLICHHEYSNDTGEVKCLKCGLILMPDETHGDWYTHSWHNYADECQRRLNDNN